MSAAAMAGVGSIPQSRLGFIDIAKGVSIALVVFGHSHLAQMWPGLNEAIALFRMPLFFFLAGIFIKVDQSFVDFALRRADRLLKPYFFTLLLILAAKLAFGRESGWTPLLGVLWGGGQTIDWIPMWFLPHLWLLSVVAFPVLKLARPGPLGGLLLFCLLIALGAVVFGATSQQHWLTMPDGRQSLGLPWGADILPLSLAFFLLGYVAFHRDKSFRPRIVPCMVLAGVYLAVVFGTQAAVDLSERVFAVPLAAALAALCGIYGVLVFAKWAERVAVLERPLVALGQASLFILIFHSAMEYRIHQWLEPGLRAAAAPLAFVAALVLPVLLGRLIARIPLLKYCYLPSPSRRLSSTRKGEEKK